jgi:AcrR family transcriptional regulator
MHPAATGLRELKKQRTRTEIQTATYELIVDQGWAATTIAAIAERAQVARRTVFAYFPTKIDIMFSDQAGSAEHLRSLLADQKVGVVDGIKQWLEWRTGDVDHVHARLRYEAIQADPELVARDYGAHIEWEKVVAEAVSSRTGEPTDGMGPRMVGACAATLWRGFREYLERDTPPFEQTYARAFDLLEQMYAAAGQYQADPPADSTAASHGSST